jgi:hypothetical protein
MMIVRCRNATQNWAVGMPSIIGNGNLLYLNGTNAVTADATVWNSTAPTSTTIAIGTSGITNGNTYNYVAYCWSQIAGYSAFGSYTGNGAVDGPFVYTGFRPRFILIKNSTTGGVSNNWAFIDSVRSYANVGNHTLAANLSDASSSFGTGVDVFGPNNMIDLVSNGFKIREASAFDNSSGDTYIYMAFAENPFKYSNAR